MRAPSLRGVRPPNAGLPLQPEHDADELRTRRDRQSLVSVGEPVADGVGRDPERAGDLRVGEATANQIGDGKLARRERNRRRWGGVSPRRGVRVAFESLTDRARDPGRRQHGLRRGRRRGTAARVGRTPPTTRISRARRRWATALGFSVWRVSRHPRPKAPAAYPTLRKT